MLTLAATNTLQGDAGTATAVTYTIFGMELASGVETYKVLAQGQLALSTGALYTVPAATTAFVKTIMLANATGTAVSSVSLFINGTAATNQILPTVTIPANGLAIVDDNGLKVYDGSGNLFTSGTNIFDATAVAATTPIALGTAGSAVVAARRDHTHQSPGGIASITAISSAINTTETVIVTATLPANFVQAGTVFRLKAFGTCTSTVSNISTFRVRWGVNGSSADTQIGTVATANAATSGTSVPFYVEFIVVFQSTTVSEVNGRLYNNGLTGITTTQTPIIGTPANTTALTTTSIEKLSLTYVSAATTTTSTFQIAEIEVVKL